MLQLYNLIVLHPDITKDSQRLNGFALKLLFLHFAYDWFCGMGMMKHGRFKGFFLIGFGLVILISISVSLDCWGRVWVVYYISMGNNSERSCTLLYIVLLHLGCPGPILGVAMETAGFVDMSHGYNQPRTWAITFLNRATKTSSVEMPPLGTLSDAEVQLLNDPTKSVKRAQLATLCRKASLKVKGTVVPFA